MKKCFETREGHPIRLRYYLFGTMALWSVFIGLSLAWNLRAEKSVLLDAARIEARTAFHKDVVYRRWNARHGGVYAPVTGGSVPNPYLDVPERDISTPLGQELTKINPAYMTRQVHELALKAHGVRGHITSLDPIRPANAPDPWETRALRDFQKGLKEVSSVEEIEGNAYMRLMRPLLTEKSCLKCHAAQGYEVGDIRGGISVSIPMAPHIAITQSHILGLCVGHGLLWLVGLVGIGFGFGRLNQQIHRRIGVEVALRESEEKARQYLDIAGVAFVALDNNGNIALINQRGLEILGYQREELTGQNWFRTCLPDRFQKDILGIYHQLMRGEVEPVEYYENPVLTKDGRERTIAWHNSVIRNPEGSIVGSISSGEDITDRLLAEEALRDSEEKYRSLFEKSINAIVNTTYQGKCIDANPAALALFGYTKEEMLKINFRRLYVDPNGGYRFQKEMKEKGSVQNFEVKLRGKGGVEMDCILDVACRLGDDGSILEYQGIIRDISEAKRAQEALKISQERLSQIIDFLPDATMVIDLEGKVIAWNRAIEDMTGINAKEMLGKGDYEYAIPFYGERRPVLIDLLGKWDKAIAKEYQYIKRDRGSLVSETYDPAVKPGGFLWNKASLLYDHNGEVIGAIESIRDITDQKIAEGAVRESEARYRGFVENAVLGVYQITKEGKFLMNNQRMANIFGYDSQQEFSAEVDNVSELYVNPKERPKILQAIDKAGHINGMEIHFRKKGGAPVFCNAYVRSIQKEDGEYIYEGFLEDITGKKKMEAQLQQANKMEAIATLAGGIAHEFNNALMGIMGNIELLEMDLPEDERRDGYLHAMQDSGHRMSRLTDQLLAYARGGKYQARNLKLDDFVMETLPILQYDLSPTVRVETHFAEDISHIKADHTQIQMVLSAILANSDEAIEDEGLIRLTAGDEDLEPGFAEQQSGLKPGPYVCLTIEDNGKGMDENTRSGIFEPFFTTKFQGRGMGMAAVYGIIRNHDGLISVDSELGRGTTVRICLPAIEIDVEKPKKAEAEITTGSGTILVIEDEDVVIEVTRGMLERAGYTVMVAKTGENAIHISETFDGQIDLVLLDIKLPDMEGGKIYPLITKARPGVKVIVFSGYDIDGPARKILDAGAEGFIQKPFSFATLSKKIKEVLEGT